MRTVALGDICDVTIGRTPSRSDASLWGAGAPWVSIADMSQGRVITSTKEQITPKAATRGKPVPAGTVLLSFKLSIGKVALAGVPLFTNEAIAALPIRDSQVIDTRYLMWALEHADLTAGSNRAAMGATLNKAKLTQIRIPILSLDEQRRVARLLDQADAIRTKRRQVLAHLDSLTQSIFHSMFGNPFTNPHGYEQHSLQSLSLKFSDGPFGSNLKTAHYRESGIPVVRLQNIGTGKYLDSDKAFVSREHYAKLTKHDCQPGDVLIATLGDPNLRACVQPQTVPLALNKADCVQMRVNPELARPIYVSWLLNHPGTLLLAQSLVQGQTRARISMGRLRTLVVPVPPLGEQTRFAHRVGAIEKQMAKAQQSASAADELFTSLQSRAFKGEL